MRMRWTAGRSIASLASASPTSPSRKPIALWSTNLRYAAGELQREGILLIVEPINHFDIPGFFLNYSAQTLAILDEAGSANLKLQYDIYHMQRMEGELAATMEKHLKRIGHIQIAGNPGRNEPDIGEINYPYLMQRLDALGYDGWVGAEYKPKGRTEDGLGWLRAWGGKA